MSYEKQTWATGQVITAEKLNHIEDGIETVEAEIPTDAYVKPSSGIPATDLATAVQTSLGKANGAIPAPSSPASGDVLKYNGSTWIADETDELSSGIKQALLNCFSAVAWTDENGQDYYDALENALYPPADLVSISAVYTQSGTVYDTDTLDSLKNDLVVTATYDDSTTETVTTYTLSGTLAEGTSTITVSYGGKTTTFNVTVTHKQASGDNVWYDGAAYENLTIVQNEYVKSADGTFATYAGWDRTGYVYCEGASSITFPPMPEEGSGIVQSSQFYQNNTGTRIAKITLSRTEYTTVTVPSNAKYFAISSNSAALAACVNAGIVPHA